MRGVDETWTADLFRFKRIQSRKSAGFRYILLTTDNFSEYAWSIPSKVNMVKR